MRDVCTAARRRGRSTRCRRRTRTRPRIDWARRRRRRRRRSSAGTRVDDVPLDDARAVHRLDASSSPPGSCKGRFPGDPRPPELRRGGARAVRQRRRALLDRIVARASCCARAASTASGRRRATATTSCSTRDESRDRELARFPMLRQQARKAERAGRICSLADFVAPVGQRRVATTSARSRSRPASAPTSWSRALRGASTTTTTRSW